MEGKRKKISTKVKQLKEDAWLSYNWKLKDPGLSYNWKLKDPGRSYSWKLEGSQGDGMGLL